MAEERTQPLLTLRALAFQLFLAKHELCVRDVARAAQVRLLVVWNITRDLPVSHQQAEMVRAGLYLLTGAGYRGGITLHPAQTAPEATPQHGLSGKCVPNRAFSLDSGETLISVREAACILDVSERSVYGYLAQGKLTKLSIEKRIMLREEEVLAFERRAPGRPREMAPPWHLPPGRNPLYLVSIIVSLRPDCDALLEQKLAEFRFQGKHEITGTCARAISRSRHAPPDRLTILLFWRAESQPCEEQCEQEIAALAADLAEVCDWETAFFHEGQTYAHAR
jgi:hypothetical protein